MTYRPSPWPNKRAIGASYCMDQSPGDEIVGGLTVTLRPKKGDTGTIVALAPQRERLTGGPLDESVVQEFTAWAQKGVRAAAEELGADLSDMDVELSEFAYHPVDSRLAVYAEAAASAFRSAWDAWLRFYDRDRRKDY